MSPYPADPEWARGPMRFVLTTYPSRERAFAAVQEALRRRLAACGNVVAADSRYWWNGEIETATEAIVLFKTVPKRVGALFRFLAEDHPYDVPEIVEVDVPRAAAPYLAYLTLTLDRSGGPGAPPPRVRRRGAPRARGARAPGRTRAPLRRRSR
jgi:periplasmic divalent cation tolerance protein